VEITESGSRGACKELTLSKALWRTANVLKVAADGASRFFALKKALKGLHHNSPGSERSHRTINLFHSAFCIPRSAFETACALQ
jgi:hypothetical protein